MWVTHCITLPDLTRHRFFFQLDNNVIISWYEYAGYDFNMHEAFTCTVLTVTHFFVKIFVWNGFVKTQFRQFRTFLYKPKHIMVMDCVINKNIFAQKVNSFVSNLWLTKLSDFLVFIYLSYAFEEIVKTNSKSVGKCETIIFK